MNSPILSNIFSSCDTRVIQWSSLLSVYFDTSILIPIMKPFVGTETHRACQDRDTMNLVCPSNKVLHIVNAMFGRLVSDNGDLENCPLGQTHNNSDNCQEPRRYDT